MNVANSLPTLAPNTKNSHFFSNQDGLSFADWATTMNEPTNPADGAFPDELISAYLDDELSPAEKLRVEEQLMDSAEHRQLFEELKALRRGMQSLPQRKLDADFAARVLQKAEKQLLADDQPVDVRPAPAISAKRPEDRGAWQG